MAPQSLDRVHEDFLVSRVAKGDSQACRELVMRYHTKVIYFIRSILNCDASRAEDLAQVTWMKMVEHSATYDPQQKFSAWLYRIAKNLCMNEARSRKVRNEQEFTEEAEAHSGESQSAEELVLSSVNSKELLDAISKLPDQQRFAIVSWYIEEQEHSAIAQNLGVSQNALSSLLSRAKKNLRRHLEEAS